MIQIFSKQSPPVQYDSKVSKQSGRNKLLHSDNTSRISKQILPLCHHPRDLKQAPSPSNHSESFKIGSFILISLQELQNNLLPFDIIP
ncbi:hypothetical protein CEXT_715401 [Caerostris extrusa]|uniref:Uncharacterized protein n=1 Tax=Caerostris extrusa TaxID=172846 RepID=A0AAV4QZT7_CAEEX|nr:hypothetical protein CEXT_715401 [Caerostris extrusa]